MYVFVASLIRTTCVIFAPWPDSRPSAASDATSIRPVGPTTRTRLGVGASAQQPARGGGPAQQHALARRLGLAGWLGQAVSFPGQGDAQEASPKGGAQTIADDRRSNGGGGDNNHHLCYSWPGICVHVIFYGV